MAHKPTTFEKVLLKYYDSLRNKYANDVEKPVTPADPNNPANNPNDLDSYQAQVDKLTDSYKKAQEEGRLAGRERAKELFNNPLEGLTQPEMRAIQESSDNQINRDMQNYQRQIAANQGRKGIRGGAAYAQNADLARLAQEAQSQFQRDLTQLDRDLSLRKTSAAYNVEQGEAGQALLDQQSALDVIRGFNEEKRQREFSEKANKYFDQHEKQTDKKAKRAESYQAFYDLLKDTTSSKPKSNKNLQRI